MDDETAEFFALLKAAAERTLHEAGPRYSPGVDRDAPNLTIQPLLEACSTLMLGSDFRARVAATRGQVGGFDEQHEGMLNGLFGQRRTSFRQLATDLHELERASSPEAARRAAYTVKRRRAALHRRIDAELDEVEGRRARLAEHQPEEGADREIHGRQIELLRSKASDLRKCLAALDDVLDLVTDDASALLSGDKSAVLLLGQWGTGKTHFLCDLTLRTLADGCPAVLVLATDLNQEIKPLDAVAQSTGLAASGSDLIETLDRVASGQGRRAAIIIDAINEADRDHWRKQLPRLLRAVAEAHHVGLIVSCRTPFDDGILTAQGRKRMLTLHHPGFEDQEFNAQLEFFTHYGLPALDVPLLTDEFSRPLFLKLMCESVRGLKKRSQREKLRDIASGQKSMTYVLEYFVKSVGGEVEARHDLSGKACWSIMKGSPRSGAPGLAGILAEEQREWLHRWEAEREVRRLTKVSDNVAAAVVRDMVTAGLLVEQTRFVDNEHLAVLCLPYQRFSDHLIARHLLDGHLDTSTESRLRRCFYADRRLGAVFLPERWGSQFSEPGIASALMIEFPERVKRQVARGVLGSTELIAYLPKSRRLLYPYADAFLSGVYWRPPSGFDDVSERLVLRMLDGSDSRLRDRTYDVLVGLGTRGDHPLGATWLIKHLAGMSLPDRDVEWSEFLRTLDGESNVRRLLAWAEARPRTKLRDSDALQAMRVISLVLTSTDRRLRDRATRALVLLGESNYQQLFQVAIELVGFGDPYVPERLLSATYGVCMRRWARETSRSTFADCIAELGERLLEQVLRTSAPHSTWNTLTRGHAIGVLHILLLLRPRSLAAADRRLLVPRPDHAPSPFRSASNIRKRDVTDPEHAIHMDFGNYTIGRLVPGRGNYDDGHREYAQVRRQIADRIRRLGYTTERFGDLDRTIGRYREYRADGTKVDRYGKKYSWIAFYEMYGLREAAGSLDDDLWRQPRTSDCGVDPSFPDQVPTWQPRRRDVFATAPTEPHKWLSDGDDPAYHELLRLPEVAGQIGDWVLLDADIHEEVGEGREARGWVTSAFAPARSIHGIRSELDSGRDIADRGLPEPGADYYTFHGEIPWSIAFGSDIRTAKGRPRHTSDRAFDYFDNGWREGIPVEVTCRRWAWESHHSSLNAGGPRPFPSPALSSAVGLRIVGGSSDMVDANLQVATVLREAPGPGYGSRFLFMRCDLLEKYMRARRLHLVQAVVGERDLGSRYFEPDLTESLRALYQSRVNRSGRLVLTSADELCSGRT